MAHVKPWILAALVAVAGCKRAGPDKVEPSNAPVSAAPTAATAPAAEFHEDTFDLELRAAGPYSAGKPAAAEIVLSPKGGFHTNDKYPYKFRTADSPGVAFRAPVFTKEDVTLDEQKARMKLDFTPESAGEKAISGQFAFSVCSADKCLVEKRDLTVKVAVN